MDRTELMELLLRILQKGDISAYADYNMGTLREIIVVTVDDRVYWVDVTEKTECYKEA